MSAPDEPHAWDSQDEDEPRRDVFAAELVEVPKPGAPNQLTEMLAQAIQNALAGIARKRAEEGEDPLSPKLIPALAAATRVTVGAIEGTLRGKSLEGALKEAQILALYAEARERNATAERIEAETQRLWMDAALDRLTRVLELVKSLGVEVKMVQLPDGRWGVAFGDRLAAELPDLQLSAGSEPAAQGGEKAAEGG